MPLPKRLPLPNPLSLRDKADSAVIQYLEEVNVELQKMNAELRRAKTGTIILDDGANWRITLQFTDGQLRNVTTAASSGATASFT